MRGGMEFVFALFGGLDVKYTGYTGYGGYIGVHCLIDVGTIHYML